MKGKSIPVIFFVITLVLLNALLAVYSTPVVGDGDASDYLQLSRVFLGRDQANLAHRSPFYSIIIALLSLIFSPPQLLKAIIYFQYMLVGLSAWLLYKIFKPLYKRDEPAMLTGLVYNLSLSTLFYANSIITETLTVFLLLVTLYQLLCFYESKNLSKLCFSSISLGFLVLTRFNTIPLVGTFLLLLIFILIRNRTTLRKSILSFLVFLVPFLLIINIWCAYNYSQHGFYDLFPRAGALTKSTINKGGGNSRNVIVSSIRPDNKVSERYRPVLDIFLSTRDSMRVRQQAKPKGSLASLDSFGFLEDLYSGYSIYHNSSSKLKAYFRISEEAGEKELGDSLSGFYREISRQNKPFIGKMRFMSFLSGFRASPVALRDDYGRINTNVLPAVVFKIHKLLFPILSVFVLLAALFFAFQTLKTGFKPNIYLLSFFAIVFSYWMINFVFNTANDANRFKYPAEPFIFGLVIYYLISLIRSLKSFVKRDTRHTKSV